MDLTRLGADIRLLRKRRGWTQVRLANEAGVPLWIVTAIEAGRADRVSVPRMAAVAIALGGVLSIRVFFRGEAMDRLRDRRHAALVEILVRLLRAGGWLVATEVSFNKYGERGSIDVLAFHPASGALLVIEVKSVVPDLGGMLMTLDRKVRLARRIARDQLGWHAKSVSRVLVLPEDRTARRRVADHVATFDAALPLRNAGVKRWLRSPSGSIAGLLFLTNAQPADDRRRSSRESAKR